MLKEAIGCGERRKKKGGRHPIRECLPVVINY